MPIRTQPPTSSARRPKMSACASPFPASRPRAVMTAQTTPIRVDGPHTFMLRREKESPTGQGVDTGRHREDEQLASFGGINRTAFSVFGIVSAAPDHVAADPCQQREGDPVIPRFDESAHGQAKGPSDHGHQELEKAERQRKAQKMHGRHPFEGAARTDRHGESIHGQCNGNGEQFWETHRVLWGLRLWASKPIRLL